MNYNFLKLQGELTIMANKHYSSPFARAVRENYYCRAELILDEHIEENRRFTTQDYSALKLYCKDLDLFWRCIKNLHLFTRQLKEEERNYYHLLSNMKHLKGASRRFNLLYKKAQSDEAISEGFINDIATFAYFYGKDEVTYNLMKKVTTFTKRYTKDLAYTNLIKECAKRKDIKFVDLLFKFHRELLFKGENTEDSSNSVLEIIANEGALEELLSHKVEDMTTDEQMEYDSYKLINLISHNKGGK